MAHFDGSSFFLGAIAGAVLLMFFAAVAAAVDREKKIEKLEAKIEKIQGGKS